jgi:hypothetical protein
MVALLGASLLLGGGAAAAPAADTPSGASTSANLAGIAHPAAGHFKPDGTAVADCKQSDFTCYEQAFGNIAYRSGPTAALDLVTKMLAANDPAVRSDCHTITHAIGSATLARVHGDAASAMGQGSMVCGSGYYHGLIEYALEGATNTQQLIDKVKHMCSDHAALKTTFLLYQCVHGLGHGVMIFSGDNLPWALSMCSELGDRWSQQSCSGGVFMQNFNLPSKLSPFRSTFVKKNDLLYPCDWVSVKYKFYCYLQVTEHILYVTGYDWKTAASTCATAPRPWSGICFQSFGRDASGASRYDPASAYDYCTLTGAGLADCVYGAVRDFTNNDTNGTRAASFCALVPTDLRGYCFYAIGTILGTFGHDSAWMASNCASLSTDYAKECQGILTNAERALITVVPQS